MKTLKMQRRWCLGDLGLIGFRELPAIWSVITGETGNPWVLLNGAWFLWFLNLVPHTANAEER